MAGITGEIEGTRFAWDVVIYDPTEADEANSVIARLSDMAGITPADDVSDATDGSDVIIQFNELLDNLRAAGILV